MPETSPIAQRLQSFGVNVASEPEAESNINDSIAAQADAATDDTAHEEEMPRPSQQTDSLLLEEAEAEPGTPAEANEQLLSQEVTLPDGEKATVQDLIQGRMRADHHAQSVQAHVEAQRQFQNMSHMLQEFEQAGWAMIAPDLQQFENVNMEQLAAANPDQYNRIKPHYDAIMRRATEFQGRLTQLHEALGQQAYQAYEAAWKQVNTDLSYSIPGFSKETLPSLNQYAMKSGGFKQEELAGFADARIWKIIAKAQAYDNLKNGRKKNTGRPVLKGMSASVESVTQTSQQRQLKAASRRGDHAATQQLLRNQIRNRLHLK